MKTIANMKKVENILKSIVSSFSKRNGIYTVRRGYFYTSGKTTNDFVDRISDVLKQEGVAFEIVDSGNHWAPFRGGASVCNQSHWYVKFSLIQNDFLPMVHNDGDFLIPSGENAGQDIRYLESDGSYNSPQRVEA